MTDIRIRLAFANPESDGSGCALRVRGELDLPAKSVSAAGTTRDVRLKLIPRTRDGRPLAVKSHVLDGHRADGGRLSFDEIVHFDHKVDKAFEVDLWAQASALHRTGMKTCPLGPETKTDSSRPEAKVVPMLNLPGHLVFDEEVADGRLGPVYSVYDAREERWLLARSFPNYAFAQAVKRQYQSSRKSTSDITLRTATTSDLRTFLLVGVRANNYYHHLMFGHDFFRPMVAAVYKLLGVEWYTARILIGRLSGDLQQPPARVA